ncbi:glycosyltransferase [Curtobacterium sp. HSID17257]|uniref:glycosyltransferase n=1 Tax=Curtobacterium sp. HSID17257 TaxID=2419510 RepID=UPI000F88CF23|nr:glycosyltransferase [Curtobacterium sp. HSID17257]RUQ09753.1 glycosyltransferase [Curtobacterium sp. HSID17257]
MQPDVIVVHDYVTQRGGAERVALALSAAYPDHPMLTALYEPKSTFPDFARVRISASFLNSIPAFRKNPQIALPFLPLAWLLRRRVDAEAVVASSSGWAHAVRVRPGTKKIVYCHNPPRWLYQTDEYLLDRSGLVRLALGMLRPLLLAWDQRAAASVDEYVANSTSVAARIEQAYGRRATVVFPPTSIDVSAGRERPPGVPDDFYLTVGRRRGYKGTDQLVRAFEKMTDKRLVVVGGTKRQAGSNVTVLNNIEDSQLRWLYANATALLSVSREDFGLTPIEANAFGTPVLALRAGGFLDSLSEGVSGQFFEDDSIEGILRSIDAFPRHWDRQAVRQHAEQFSRGNFLSRIEAVVSRALRDRPAVSKSAGAVMPETRSGEEREG